MKPYSYKTDEVNKAGEPTIHIHNYPLGRIGGREDVTVSLFFTSERESVMVTVKWTADDSDPLGHDAAHAYIDREQLTKDLASMRANLFLLLYGIAAYVLLDIDNLASV